MNQLSKVEQMIELERQEFTPLSYGSRGVTWTAHPGVISPDNPLMFTCAECRVTSSGHDPELFTHKKGCKVALMNKLGM